MSAPARCDCGWELPAAFSLLVPGEPTLVKSGTTIQFACGSCGNWFTCALGNLGAARTPNADGFGMMPSERMCKIQ